MRNLEPVTWQVGLICATYLLLVLFGNDQSLQNQFLLIGFAYLSGKAPDKWGKA